MYIDLQKYIRYIYIHARILKIYSDGDQHNIHHRHLNNLLCKCANNKFDERNIFTGGFSSHE